MQDYQSPRSVERRSSSASIRSFARPVASLFRKRASSWTTLSGLLKSVAEKRGKPCQATAIAPTIRYSTSFAFQHSINWRQSFGRSMVCVSLTQLEVDLEPLLGEAYWRGLSGRRLPLPRNCGIRGRLSPEAHFTARAGARTVSRRLRRAWLADRIRAGRTER